MVSLRNSLTLVRLLRAYTNARRSGRYRYWLGMALVMAFVVGAGVKLARVTADVSSNMIITAPAASFEREVPLAPGSIVVASGANLATQTVSAPSVDADLNTPGFQLPTELGGTTVTVNGRPAELFFVGKLKDYDQVNFLMPEGTTPGQAADIVVKSGDGVTSRGTAQIANVSPAIFTMNCCGSGVPAAYLVRGKQSGEISYESPFQLNTSTRRYTTKPIDLKPEGDKVFLVLYMSGLRHAERDSVSVLIGGVKVAPYSFDQAPGFVGLDQLNVEIPRGLIDRGIVGPVKVSVDAGGRSSNPVDIEIGGSVIVVPTGPRVSGPVGQAALAGEPMVILGSGFDPDPPKNIVSIAGHLADVMEAKSTELKVMVPFGVETGTVRVTTPTGEGVSEFELQVQTSISGLVEDTSRQPLNKVTVIARLQPSDPEITGTTDPEGHFVLFKQDMKPGIYSVTVDGNSLGIDPPIPLVELKVEVRINRDNAISDTIYLQQATGSSGTVGSAPSTGGNGGSALKAARVKVGGPEPVTIVTDGKFRLEVQGGTKASGFPPTKENKEGTIGDIFLTQLKDSRTPVELPFGYFSSSIVQITPFGVNLDPGAKLVFPNDDGLPAGVPAILFRYDPSVGKFLQDEAVARVSADGNRIETDAGAIKVTSYYFATMSRQLTTITGRVFENDGVKPVVGAVARFRGREAVTDGSGSYTLRYVSVAEPGEMVSVEVSVVRPNGRVDRKDSDKVPAKIGDTTEAPNVIMPKVTENRPPTIIGPKRLEIQEGTTKESNLIVSDPDPNQKLTVTITGAPFAKVIAGGTGAALAYQLKLTPDFTHGRQEPYTLTITVTDDAKDPVDPTKPPGKASLNVDVTVKNVNRAPSVNNQTVALNEDTSASIKLTGSDPDLEDQGKLNFTIVDQPLNGKLSGDASDLIYTPNLNFAGTDRFTFKASDSKDVSNIATVTITVRPVNDPPSLIVPGARTVREGQAIILNIDAFDPDTGQKVTISPVGSLPSGATLAQATATSAQLRWTPSFVQAGTYTITFRATDDAALPLSDTKPLKITVLDSQHDFSEDPTDLTVLGTSGSTSPSRSGGAGSAVKFGDVDGDGMDDLVFSAPYDNGAGQVYILLGRGNPRGTVDLANKSPDIIIRGEDSNGLFGSSLAIGDLNGDGKADLIVSAPAADAPGRVDNGKVYAVFGSLTPGTYDIAKIANLTILGASSDDHLGVSVAVGKIGGITGPDSLIIGAPGFDVPGTGASLPNAGCVYGFFGGVSLAGVKDLLSAPSDFTVAGAVADGQFGFSLATGDFNADGSDDFAIGAPTAGSSALKAAGSVYLVLGSPSLKDAVTPLTIFGGADPGDAAGSSLAMRDLNGDGRAELVIGAPGAGGPDNKRPGAGEVYILFGATDLQRPLSALTIYGGGASVDEFPDGLGTSVDAGDFTGDGTPDLIMGAPGADSSGSMRQGVGAAYMIFGGAGFAAGTFDLTSQTPDLKIFGAKPGDRLGSGGFAFGKLYLSGANDLVIGVPAASRDDSSPAGAGGAGEVRVLRGVVR